MVKNKHHKYARILFILTLKKTKSFIFADEGTRFNIVFVDALSIKVKPSIKAKSLFDKEAIVVLRITNLQTTGTSIRVNNKDELSFHYYVIISY